jgi:hypothetical protein
MDDFTPEQRVQYMKMQKFVALAGAAMTVVEAEGGFTPQEVTRGMLSFASWIFVTYTALAKPGRLEENKKDILAILAYVIESVTAVTEDECVELREQREEIRRKSTRVEDLEKLLLGNLEEFLKDVKKSKMQSE